MLRLHPFRLVQPASLTEALHALDEALRAKRRVRVLAGGTDLLPNLKHELDQPDLVISLGRLPLAYERRGADGVVLGALTTLHSLAESELVRGHLPALADAARSVAGPQLRRMGTLGGNVCLDTRCRYINQSYFWRSSLGYCLKKDGTVCHVVAGGKNCVAALQSDTTLPLIAHGATALVASVRGERVLPVAELYGADGAQHMALAADELLVELRVPVLAAREACVFEKVRLREAIDFACVHLAAHVALDDDGKVRTLRAVVGSLGPRPRVVSFDAAVGAELDEATVQAAAARLEHAVKPLAQLSVDAEWRRAMVGVSLRRALGRAARVLAAAASR